MSAEAGLIAAEPIATATAAAPSRAPGRRLTEPAVVRWTLTIVSLAFLALFLGVPLTAVFVEAFAILRRSVPGAIHFPVASAPAF